MTEAEVQALEDVVARLTRGDSVPADEWPLDAGLAPGDLGFTVSASRIHADSSIDLISVAQVQKALPSLGVRKYSLIDSTNSRMVALGRERSVDEQLYLAEFQYGGRGRRGRVWLSPYARNIAVSLGQRTFRPLDGLGGLSLVVGLALVDALEELGVREAQLKWPNDVLIGEKKVSGILVEVIQRQNVVEYVVGIGINVDLTDHERLIINQPVADLRGCGVELIRTDLTVHVIGRVLRFLRHFEQEGFSPFVTAFNNIHKFQGDTCTIHQGREHTTGEVVGVGEHGQLILDTPDGLRHFHGGEVSLRPVG